MKVFLNPGHCPGADSGACGHGLKEADVTAAVGELVQGYLEAAGVDTYLLQVNSLSEISATSNAWGADLFVSIHCNSAGTDKARGTETYCFYGAAEGYGLASCIQNQIVGSLGTVDRGVKEIDFSVLRNTDCPACLVEMAFINNVEDAALLRDRQDDFARAIARGVTDYISGGDDEVEESMEETSGGSKYFGPEELMCHGASQGHCNCGIESAENVDPRLLELLDRLRELVGGPLELSCAYRCQEHNDAIPGSVPNSQHVDGTAADVQTPNFPHCNTPEELLWYCEQLPFDGIGLYDWGVHVDVRDGGIGSGIRW